MTSLVIVLGVLTSLSSFFALVRPAMFLDLLGTLEVSTRLRMLLVVTRILVGTMLVLAAPATRLSLFVWAVGVLSVTKGFILLVVDTQRLQSWVNWAIALRPSVIRIGAMAGLALGVALLYAAL